MKNRLIDNLKYALLVSVLIALVGLCNTSCKKDGDAMEECVQEQTLKSKLVGGWRLTDNNCVDSCTVLLDSLLFQDDNTMLYTYNTNDVYNFDYTIVDSTITIDLNDTLELVQFIFDGSGDFEVVSTGTFTKTFPIVFDESDRMVVDFIIRFPVFSACDKPHCSEYYYTKTGS